MSQVIVPSGVPAGLVPKRVPVTVTVGLLEVIAAGAKVTPVILSCGTGVTTVGFSVGGGVSAVCCGVAVVFCCWVVWVRWPMVVGVCCPCVAAVVCWPWLVGVESVVLVGGALLMVLFLVLVVAWVWWASEFVGGWACWCPIANRMNVKMSTAPITPAAAPSGRRWSSR